MKKLFNSKIHILTVLFISLIIFMTSACKNSFAPNQADKGKILPLFGSTSRTIFPAIDKNDLTDFVLYKDSVNDANKIGNWADITAFSSTEAIDIDIGTYSFILTAKLGTLSFSGSVSGVKIEANKTSSPNFVLSMDNLGDSTTGTLSLSVVFPDDDIKTFDKDSLKVKLVSLSDTSTDLNPKTEINESGSTLLITASLPAGKYLITVEAKKNNGVQYMTYSEVAVIASGLVSSKTYTSEGFITVLDVSTETKEDGSTVTTTTGTTESGADYEKQEEKDSEGNVTKTTETETASDGSSTEIVTQKNTDGDVVVKETQKDAEGNTTKESEATINEDGSKTEKTDFGSGDEKITVNTEVDKDGNVTAEAKDSDGKEIELTEYELPSNHKWAANYETYFPLRDFLPGEDFVKGDVITLKFTGIAKTSLRNLYFRVVANKAADNWWCELADPVFSLENCEAGDCANFCVDINITTQAKTRDFDDVSLVITSDYLEGETQEGEHKDSVSILGNLYASIDKSNGNKKVQINFDYDKTLGTSSAEPIELYPGQAITESVKVSDPMTFYGWYNGDTKTTVAPDTSCTLTARIENPREGETESNTTISETASVSQDYIFNTDSVGFTTITIRRSEWNKMLSYYDYFYKNENLVTAESYEYEKDGQTWQLNKVGLRLRGNTSRFRPQGKDYKYDAQGNLKANGEWNKNYYSYAQDCDDGDYRQSHFKVDFEPYTDDDRKMSDCMKSVALKRCDSLFTREIFCYNLFHQFGIWTAPRASQTKVYIKFYEDICADGSTNDDFTSCETTLVDFGVYEMFEEVNKQSLKGRMKKDDNNTAENAWENNKGDLWKCSGGEATLTAGSNVSSNFGVEQVEILNTDKDKSDWKAVWNSYRYDLKTNKDNVTSAADYFSAFITELNNLSDIDRFTEEGENARKAFYEKWFDVDFFIKTYAVNMLVGMDDDYWGNANNYYLYFDNGKNGSGKCYLIPFDYDNTLGYSISGDKVLTNPFEWGKGNDRPLIDRLLEVPEYAEKFRDALLEVSSQDAASPWNKDNCIALWSKWHTQVDPYVYSKDIEGHYIGVTAIYDDGGWKEQKHYLKVGKDNIYEQVTANFKKWLEVDERTITFDLNGGTYKGSTAAVAVTYNGLTNQYDEMLGTPTREGYDFVGWTTTKDGTVFVEKYNNEEDLTLYASWVDISGFEDNALSIIEIKDSTYEGIKCDIINLPENNYRRTIYMRKEGEKNFIDVGGDAKDGSKYGKIWAYPFTEAGKTYEFYIEYLNEDYGHLAYSNTISIKADSGLGEFKVTNTPEFYIENNILKWKTEPVIQVGDGNSTTTAFSWDEHYTIQVQSTRTTISGQEYYWNYKKWENIGASCNEGYDFSQVVDDNVLNGTHYDLTFQLKYEYNYSSCTYGNYYLIIPGCDWDTRFNLNEEAVFADGRIVLDRDERGIKATFKWINGLESLPEWSTLNFGNEISLSLGDTCIPTKKNPVIEAYYPFTEFNETYNVYWDSTGESGKIMAGGGLGDPDFSKYDKIIVASKDDGDARITSVDITKEQLVSILQPYESSIKTVKAGITWFTEGWNWVINKFETVFEHDSEAETYTYYDDELALYNTGFDVFHVNEASKTPVTVNRELSVSDTYLACFQLEIRLNGSDAYYYVNGKNNNTGWIPFNPAVVVNAELGSFEMYENHPWTDDGTQDLTVISNYQQVIDLTSQTLLLKAGDKFRVHLKGVCNIDIPVLYARTCESTASVNWWAETDAAWTGLYTEDNILAENIKAGDLIDIYKVYTLSQDAAEKVQLCLNYDADVGEAAQFSNEYSVTANITIQSTSDLSVTQAEDDDEITLTAASGFESYEWKMGSKTIGTDSVFVFDKTKYAAASYIITLYAVKDSKKYSCNVLIDVE